MAVCLSGIWCKEQVCNGLKAPFSVTSQLSVAAGNWLVSIYPKF